MDLGIDYRHICILFCTIHWLLFTHVGSPRSSETRLWIPHISTCSSYHHRNLKWTSSVAAVLCPCANRQMRMVQPVVRVDRERSSNQGGLFFKVRHGVPERVQHSCPSCPSRNVPNHYCLQLHVSPDMMQQFLVASVWERIEQNGMEFYP